MSLDESSDWRDRILFRPRGNPKHQKLLEAAGVWDWLNGGELRSAVCSRIGYGGAAFGGKTYGTLGLASCVAMAFPGAQIGWFRRTYPEMTGPDAAIVKAYEVFRGIAKPRDSGKEWHFETGSVVYFRHCERELDRFKYQSQDMDMLIIDQAEHFTWVIVDYLLTRNRVTSGIERRGIFKPFSVLTANPGNVGHMWYMKHFGIGDEVLIEGGEERHMQVREVVNPSGKKSQIYFIPAFIHDNKVGLERDPDYPERLREADPALADALERGDWSIFSGQAFSDFSFDRHVVEPIELPRSWPKWRAVDWGWDHPFCCLWFARDPGTKRIYVYREIVVSGLTDKEQAQMIVENSPAEENVTITYADPSMWASKNADGLITSSQLEYMKNGVPLFKADNNRIMGVKRIHSLFADIADGKPGLQIFSNCRNLIYTIPKLAKSEINPEDVEKINGDDSFDTLKYGTSESYLHTRKRKKRNPLDNPYMRIRGML